MHTIITILEDNNTSLYEIANREGFAEFMDEYESKVKGIEDINNLVERYEKLFGEFMDCETKHNLEGLDLISDGIFEYLESIQEK